MRLYRISVGMKHKNRPVVWWPTATLFTLGIGIGLVSCTDEEALGDATSAAGSSSSGQEGGSGGEGSPRDRRYLLGSVTIDADGNRVSYAQIIDGLEGTFTNEDGIEANGNAVFLTHGSDFFYGQAETPVWIRYSTKNGFEETGRISFANFGVTYMDFNNVIVDDETAVSVLTDVYLAVIWNPKTMKIEGTIDLAQMARDGYSLEAWAPVTRQGLVYVPGRWANWDGLQIDQIVSMTVLDPKKRTIVGVAEDTRCGSAGRITFDSKGYGYVMGDGRNQSMQTFAASRGDAVVPNCLLRMPPGKIEFEKDFFFEIPELTGGLDSMTELQGASVDANYAFTMMKYEDRIPEDADRLNFEHWNVPAYEMWRITLGDEPSAEVVKGANFSVIGFGPSGIDGKLYDPESDDGSTSIVYEIDPEKNTSTKKFSMQGYFAGLLPLD